MNRLLIFVILSCNNVFAQSELPQCVDVHITQFIQFYKYSDASNNEAILQPDSISYETTDCNYVIDFNKNICEVYFKGVVIGSAPIVDILQDSSQIVIKLDDAADDTELTLDISKNVFVYGYGYETERIVTLPTKFTITATK